MGMSREEAIENLKELIDTYITCHGEEDTIAVSLDNVDVEAFDMAIKALQEPRKDEVILTKEEYGELVSSEFDNGYAKGYREALEQEPKWIPVSEKMPLIPQRVLVSTTNGVVFIARYHSIDKWTFELTGISYVYNKDSVVAWMPLPEFFKESEDKK